MGLADDVFGPPPGQASLADRVFGPAKGPNLADQVFGPPKLPDPVETAKSLVPDWILENAPTVGEMSTYHDVPENIADMPASLYRAKGAAAKDAIYKGYGLKRRYEAPPKLYSKSQKMQAQAKGPLAESFKQEVQETMQPYTGSVGELSGTPEEMTRTSLEMLRTSNRPIRAGELETGAEITPEDVQRQGEALKMTQREIDEHKQRMEMPFLQSGTAQRYTGGALTWMDKIFGAPFRVAGAAALSAQEQLKEAAGEMEGVKVKGGKQDAPGLGDRLWKSLTYEEPIYMGSVMEKAGESLAGRELTEGERTVAHLFGLFTELAAPGAAVKGLRLGRGAPMPKALARQAENTLARKGVRVVGKKPTTRTFWTGATKEVPEKALGAEVKAVSRHELKRLGERAAEAATHPERVRTFLDELKAVGKNLGVSDDMIDVLEREAIRRMGKEGARFGKSGVQLARPMSKEAAKTTQLAEAERIKQAGEKWIPGAETVKPSGVPPRDVPLGGMRSGTAKIPGIGGLGDGEAEPVLQEPGSRGGGRRGPGDRKGNRLRGAVPGNLSPA